MQRSIFVRALWWKEYRQTRVLLWLMMIAGFFSTAYLHMREVWFASPQVIVGLVEYLAKTQETNWLLHRNYGGFMLLLVLGGFLLSLWQLGHERRNQMSEQTFALPYPRWVIYVTKWLVSVAYIVFVVTASVALDILVLKLSQVGAYVHVIDFIGRGFHIIFVTVAAYTFTLFIGSFTGTWTLQAALSIISLFLYEFFTLMLQQLLYIFMITPIYMELRLRGTFWEKFNLTNWVFHEGGNYPYAFVGVVSLLLFIAGMVLYSRNSLENNGKLVLFPIIEKLFIVGFVLCAALFSGNLSYDTLYPGRLGYAAGAGLGTIIGYIIIRTLTRMRVRT
ncbi:acetoin ABC transporter permease [Paenibacillus profundus]|uniref:Acetoin ABC transporter permease n=1 Tax=Paenibacillus profundus TaxID=1173085 RepID=A0ABS8Y9W7_9BACL|nr:MULTISPECIES: hypothetical protein [Paenibacillus]MCE5168656.1 acetoin ABC transporter permease [Paenibacillus profundus]